MHCKYRQKNMGSQEIKRKILVNGLIIVLGGIVIWLLYDRQSYKQYFETGYYNKVRELNSEIEGHYIANRNILIYVDSVETENVKLNGRRSEGKTKWRNKYIEVFADCDTVNLAELNSLHIESELICDTVLFQKDLQIDALKKVISNDSTIIQLKDSVINVYADAYLDLEERSKRDKRKGFLKGFGVGFVSGLITGKLVPKD